MDQRDLHRTAPSHFDRSPSPAASEAHRISIASSVSALSDDNPITTQSSGFENHAVREVTPTPRGFGRPISRRPVPSQSRNLQNGSLQESVNRPQRIPVDEDAQEEEQVANETSHLVSNQRNLTSVNQEQPQQDDGNHADVSETKAAYLREAFPKWPFEASTLERGGAVFIFGIIIDVLLLLVPICFMTIAVLAEVLNQKPVASHSWGFSLITVTGYGTTAWTILFAAILGRAFKMIACWRTYRGETIGRLEQLLGSTTVFGTLETQIMLKSYNFLTIALVLLWTLSPVGSQSALRLLSVQDHHVSSQSSLYYLDLGANGTGDVFSDNVGGKQDTVVAIYEAALIAPNATLDGPRDTWGNVKIPRLDSLDQTTTGRDDWIKIATTNISFSSIIGLPVANISSSGTTKFVIPSSYYQLSCPGGPQLLPWDDEILWGDVAGGLVRGSKQSVNGFGTKRFDTTDAGVASLPDNPISFWSIGTFNTYCPGSSCRNISSGPGSILFQFDTLGINGSTINPRGIVSLSCLVEFISVESQVACDARDCQVAGMRSMQTGINSTFTSPLDDTSTAVNFYAYFVATSGTRRSITNFDTSSPMIRYLNTGFNPLGTTHNYDNADLANVPGNVLAERMGRLMSSFWYSAMTPENITGNLVPGGGLGHNTTIEDALNRHTNATLVVTEKIFACSPIWFSFLLISSLILFAIASFATYLKYYRTHAPDILGHISSFTMDNQNFHNIPPGGSVLDGFERAWHLRHVKIKFGDTMPDEEIGHIAIMSVDERGTSRFLKNLDRARRYN